MNLSEQFTLLIPTFNRPLLLARLLRYLAKHGAEFPILVLDSSHESARMENAAATRGLGLNLRVITYPPSLTPFEKFSHGSREVTTAYCGLCADDDVLITDSLTTLISFLESRRDFGAAHGWYFGFYFTDHVGVTSIVYSSPSIDRDDSLDRLVDLFSQYEAVTYALYRTDVFRQALAQVQPLASMMGRELLAGAITVVLGKVARLPVLYYGRALGNSIILDHWHPISFLIASPEQMMAEYGQYRQILLEAFQKFDHAGRDPRTLQKIVDLIHLRYASDYFTPQVLGYLVREVMAGADSGKIMQGIWPLLAPTASPTLDRLRTIGLLRKVRDRFWPGLRFSSEMGLRAFGRTMFGLSDRSVATTTAAGNAREYRLYRGFLSALARPDGDIPPDAAEGLIRSLDAYE